MTIGEAQQQQQQQQHYHDIEALALQCVAYIKDFINILRSIPEFNNILLLHNSSKEQIIRNNKTKSINRCSPGEAFNHQSNIADVPLLLLLYTHIKETTSLCDNIQNLYNTTTTTIITTTTNEIVTTAAQTSSSSTTSGNVLHYWNILPNLILLSNNNNEESTCIGSLSSERIQLLYHILLPLIATLGSCYEILDEISTSSSSPSSQSIMNPTITTSVTKTSKDKPIPPIGMLSLQNYTDIACFIEFILCNYVISPFPYNNIVVPLHDRVRYHIPKSIAGRIPILSLLWSSSSSSSSSSTSSKESSPSPTKLSPTDPSLIQEWETITCILGRLLLLDRFRPMLLPRHISDIMAMVLYCHEFSNHNNNNNNNSYIPYNIIVNSWIGINTTTPYHNNNNPIPIVDTYWRVKAYQSLLRNGRTAPVWIRKIIGQHLTQVATYDLSILVTVFVNEAFDQDYSAAALRLAQALVSRNMQSDKGTNTSASANDQYFHSLCEQMVSLLDACSLNAVTNKVSVQSGAIIETVWAVLDLLPKPMIETTFYELLVLNDINIRPNPNNANNAFDSDLHKITRRLITLYSIVPSNLTCVNAVSYLLFKPLHLLQLSASFDESYQLHEMFLFGVVVRLAANQNILKSTVKDDAIYMLKLFVNAILQKQIGAANDRNKSTSGADVLVVAILRSVLTCSFDSDLYVFELPCQEPCAELSLLSVQIKKLILCDDAKMDFLVKGVEDRMRQITRILLTCSTKDEDDIESNTVLSLLFQTLLAAYFCPDTFDLVRDVPFLSHDKMFRIVTMVSLPVICEECPPEVLLSHGGSDYNILTVLGIVISSMRANCLMLQDKVHDVIFQQDERRHRTANISHRILDADRMVFPHFQQHRTQTHNEFGFGSPDCDMIVSMTSVILGLLVSLLELGAKHRTAEQETILKSFVPDLLVIANSSTSTAKMDSNLIQELARIAELASFVAASIVTRQVSIEHMSTDIIDQDSSLDYLQKAERDMCSELPPIRARSMVQLRHRVVEISEQGKQNNFIVRTRGDDDLFTILLLCMKALNDKESYVYLAAIHTIVAIADVDPSRFVRIIGIALVTGSLHSPDNGETIPVCELNFEQRAKLTEALVFIVRRRNTFYPMLPFLIDLLIIGLKRDNEAPDEHDTRFIHDATHRYFVSGTYDDLSINSEGEFESSLDEYWKEVDIRVRTGGPLFERESSDIVRSGMVCVVSDLVSILSSSLTARYAMIMISCCIDTLRLDAARPVRRAGATLARELYGALVREQDEFLDAVTSKSNFDVVLGMAMVDGHEEVLFNVLRRIVAYADHSIKINGMERLNDPSLNARCQEAIMLRNNADQGGILLAGKVALKAKEVDDSSFVSRLLKKDSSTPFRTLKIQEL